MATKMEQYGSDRYSANGFKRCTRCGSYKPTNVFTVNRARFDGLSAHCKLCDRLSRLNESPAQRERRLERMRLWKQENAEYVKTYRDSRR